MQKVHGYISKMNKNNWTLQRIWILNVLAVTERSGEFRLVDGNNVSASERWARHVKHTFFN